MFSAFAFARTRVVSRTRRAQSDRSMQSRGCIPQNPEVAERPIQLILTAVALRQTLFIYSIGVQSQ